MWAASFSFKLVSEKVTLDLRPAFPLQDTTGDSEAASGHKSFSALSDTVKQLGVGAPVIVGGDFNARGQLDMQADVASPLPTVPPLNQDPDTNTNGDLLIFTAESAELSIVNGNTQSSIEAHPPACFTFHRYFHHGNPPQAACARSAVDYFLTSLPRTSP